MSDIRHNPDLDDALGMGRPSVPYPAPPGSQWVWRDAEGDQFWELKSDESELPDLDVDPWDDLPADVADQLSGVSSVRSKPLPQVASVPVPVPDPAGLDPADTATPNAIPIQPPQQRPGLPPGVVPPSVAGGGGGKPHGAVPVANPAPNGGGPGVATGDPATETVRVLIDIRQLLIDHFRQSLTASRTGSDDSSAGTSTGGGLSPITDLLGNTKLGRIGRKWWEKTRGLRDVIRQSMKGKPSAPPRAPRAPKGGKPGGPALPAGTQVRAGGAGAGAAGAGAEAAAGAGMVEAGVAAAGGPIGITLAAYAASAVAIYEVVAATKQLAREQEAWVRQLAQSSPDAAYSAAKLDASRTFRDVETGRMTGESNDFADGEHQPVRAIHAEDGSDPGRSPQRGGQRRDALAG